MINWLELPHRLRAAYDDGWYAFMEEDEILEENYYHEGTKEWDYWRKGWLDAEVADRNMGG